MTTQNIVPKLVMNLQLFAEKGDKAESTELQSDTSEFVYDENFFTGGKDDETPDWLKDDEEVKDTEVKEETEETEEADVVDEVDKEETLDDKQSDKTNAKFADMRRKQKVFEAKQKEFEAKEKKYNKWAKDNFNLDSFESYLTTMDGQISENKIKELEEKGYDVKAIQEAVKLDPTYQSMKDMLEAAKTSEVNEDVEESAETKEKPIDEVRLNAEYNALQSKLPQFVTKPEDISNDVWDLYDKGVNLTTAYKVINEEKISKESTKKTKEIARQETLNKLGSKSHLKTEKESNSNSANDVFIDKDTMSVYKSMGITEKQAIKFERQLKGGK